jgi:hypothetical protein
VNPEEKKPGSAARHLKSQPQKNPKGAEKKIRKGEKGCIFIADMIKSNF